MRSLRWVGLVFSLLIVGVLGGLMAALPSEAAPTLTIDGVNVGLTQITCADTGYNSCWSLNGTSPRTIGVWKVGDASATNKARVLINDVSTAGSVDTMKLTGVTFTPVVAAGTKVTNAVVTNLYNQTAGGNPAGSFSWAMSQGGYFDPPSNENVVGNRLKLTGTSTVGALGVLDTLTLTSPTINNLVGYINKSLAARVVNASCNTGSNKCAPTVTYTYQITIVGLDTLYLTDSVFGCGGTCRGAGDDGEGGGEGGEGLPLCTDFFVTCDTPTKAAVAAIVASGIAAGGVEACGGGNCIVNIVKGTPARKAAGTTFVFTATGPGVEPPLSPFSILTAANGIGYHTSKDLATGPTVAPRTFNIPTYPAGWQTDQISCVSLLNNNTSTYTVDGGSVKGPLRVLTLGAGDTLTCTWHVHNSR